MFSIVLPVVVPILAKPPVKLIPYAGAVPPELLIVIEPIILPCMLLAVVVPALKAIPVKVELAVELVQVPDAAEPPVTGALPPMVLVLMVILLPPERKLIAVCVAAGVPE